MEQIKLTTDEKISTIVTVYVELVKTYCQQHKINYKQMCEKLLLRYNSVRLAKVANFEVSGTKLSDIFDNDSLYTITNKVYGEFRRATEVSVDSIQDDELLAQLMS